MNEISETRLSTCRKELQEIVRRVDVLYPCLVLEGHRGEVKQNAVFQEGKSQVRWPNGKHNTLPSFAVDVIPLPVSWTDREAFSHFAGFMLGVAECMGYRLRWGGSWEGLGKLATNKFDDLPHFELVLPAVSDRVRGGTA
jgi:hypothetical protein